MFSISKQEYTCFYLLKFSFIAISDIRRNCDIEFSYILDSKAGAVATVMCTGEEDCDFSIYNATSNGSLMDQIPSGGTRDFPIELMVNYSYEATCQLPANDDNCLQSVKYIGLFSAGMHNIICIAAFACVNLCGSRRDVHNETRIALTLE